MEERSKLIEVTELKKYFPLKKGADKRKNPVAKGVDGVSFVIEKGSIMGIIGESGCGKSTTEKTVLRLLEPTGGCVRYKDRILFDVENHIYMKDRELAKLRREMQIVFQDPYASLDPKQTIGKAIAEGVIKHNTVAREERSDYCGEMLRMCGLDPALADRFPHEFSGGQRQRIGIARALAVKPEFLVCDEPTAALDVSVQSQILNLMLDLKEKMNLTYLFISHNMNVVRNMCDKIAVMYLGKIVEMADAEELCGAPCHPYTQALISAVPKENPWDEKRHIYLEGTIPAASNIPEGCRFCTRCKYAQEKCRKEEPALLEIEQNHFVACHFA